MKLIDMVEVLAPDAERKIIGIRPGEKLHEALLTSEETRHTVEVEDGYVISPLGPIALQVDEIGTPLPEGFVYTSDRNNDWLTKEQFAAFLEQHQRGDRFVF
jgi:UDP-N-acetylglucosamine 4,6-dehydratase